MTDYEYVENTRITILEAENERERELFSTATKAYFADAMETKALLDRAKALLKEVNGWHSDPESAEFNACSVAPCDWCKRALELLK